MTAGREWAAWYRELQASNPAEQKRVEYCGKPVFSEHWGWLVAIGNCLERCSKVRATSRSGGASPSEVVGRNYR